MLLKMLCSLFGANPEPQIVRVVATPKLAQDCDDSSNLAGAAWARSGRSSPTRAPPTTAAARKVATTARQPDRARLVTSEVLLSPRRAQQGEVVPGRP